MNIDKLIAQETTHAQSRLEALYGTIPFSRELLAAIAAGHAEFTNLLAATGLLEQVGLLTSAVHDYRDIEVHAFILGIVSAGRWQEVQAKSFLTYASHWIDDFFDGDLENGNFFQLMSDRHDIVSALGNMGPVGKVGFAMAKRAHHPEAVYRALHRMLYGGLVQRRSERSERGRLVHEYMAVATRFVAPELAEEITQLQPEAYWATNKTVLELLYAAEENIDFTTAELWNLVYAPAIYYQDFDEERERGELSFEEDEAPRLEEMIRMIRLGARHLTGRYERDSLELQQLRFAALALPNLPDAIMNEYRMLWESGARASSGLGLALAR